VGCILVEREVSARPVMVREIAGQSAAQVPFAEDEDMIQTLAPIRADEPLRERIRPGAVRRRQDFTDAHALQKREEVKWVQRSGSQGEPFDEPVDLPQRGIFAKKGLDLADRVDHTTVLQSGVASSIVRWSVLE
jgi:hypothetical protein